MACVPSAAGPSRGGDVELLEISLASSRERHVPGDARASSSETDEEDADEDVIESLVEGPAEGGSPFVPADLNQDGSVDGADLAMLLSEWGTQGGRADLNGNGFVEGADLAVLLSHWQ